MPNWHVLCARCLVLLSGPIWDCEVMGHDLYCWPVPRRCRSQMSLVRAFPGGGTVWGASVDRGSVPRASRGVSHGPRLVGHGAGHPVHLLFCVRAVG